MEDFLKTHTEEYKRTTEDHRVFINFSVHLCLSSVKLCGTKEAFLGQLFFPHHLGLNILAELIGNDVI